ncbi:MAG: potassium-transporting ATPase subunit KdpC, partial [Thermoleophilia bacterium]|nr:potassium-transporting ATPase subunit KdpC [Thermoleophilia bacterium]
MKDAIRTSVAMLAILTVLTGVVYPALVTAIAQAAFPAHSNGLMILRDGKAVGSALVGQSFTSPRYFWGRPSATAPVPYNASSSGGSNLGPLNPALTRDVAARVAALRQAHPALKGVPVDLATASASGLDPHISPAAAELQVGRVAAARGKP